MNGELVIYEEEKKLLKKKIKEYELILDDQESVINVLKKEVLDDSRSEYVS
jgi:DNA gyrase/topoisomerase IV subunit A